jgi:hypothetical protein
MASSSHLGSIVWAAASAAAPPSISAPADAHTRGLLPGLLCGDSFAPLCGVRPLSPPRRHARPRPGSSRATPRVRFLGKRRDRVRHGPGRQSPSGTVAQAPPWPQPSGVRLARNPRLLNGYPILIGGGRTSRPGRHDSPGAAPPVAYQAHDHPSRLPRGPVLPATVRPRPPPPARGPLRAGCPVGQRALRRTSDCSGSAVDYGVTVRPRALGRASGARATEKTDLLAQMRACIRFHPRIG